MIELRTAAWACRSLRRARRSLASDPLGPLVLPPVPTGTAGERGLTGALTIARATCLERAAIRQVWLGAHGEARDLVIGVTGPRRFTAHAWLDGDEDAGDYVEITRKSSRIQPIARRV